MSEETYYIKGPTYEDQLRDEHKPGYNPRFVTTRRYQLAKPLLKLWERALGKEVAGSVGKALLVGHKVLMYTRIRFRDEPNTHPQDREAYEAEIERLREIQARLEDDLRKARDVATDAENLARALRRIDGTINDRNEAVRHQRRETA